MNRMHFILFAVAILTSHSSVAFGEDIFDAVNSGNVERVKVVLHSDPHSVNETDLILDTPLHNAVTEKRTDVTELLLADTADPNARNKFDQTPLFYAQTAEQASLLVKSGATVNIVDNQGMTPLHRVAIDNRLGVAQVLVSAGAQLEAKDNRGDTPLHKASGTASMGVLTLLIANGARIEAQNIDGRTPIFGAGQAYNPPTSAEQVMETLRKAGANLNARDKDQKTPLIVACEENDPEKVNWLLQHHVDVNATDRFGETALRNVESAKLAFPFSRFSNEPEPTRRIMKMHTDKRDAIIKLLKEYGPTY